MKTTKDDLQVDLKIVKGQCLVWGFCYGSFGDYAGGARMGDQLGNIVLAKIPSVSLQGVM